MITGTNGMGEDELVPLFAKYKFGVEEFLNSMPSITKFLPVLLPDVGIRWQRTSLAEQEQLWDPKAIGGVFIPRRSTTKRSPTAGGFDCFQAPKPQALKSYNFNQVLGW